MADESFPLPGSSFKQLEKIISSYAVVKTEAAPAEVATLAGTDATNVSRNNKFLVATGVVEGTLKKKATTFGEELGRAIQYLQPETEKELWREMVDRVEFFQKLISAVRIRRGMDSASLTNHIAFSAGVPKNTQMMAGAGAVLEILVRSGALEEQGGVLVVAESKAATAGIEVKVKNPSGSYWIEPSTHQPISASGALFAEPKRSVSSEEGKIGVQIQIQIACTPADLDSLGPKLRKMLSDLRAPESGRDAASAEHKLTDSVDGDIN